MTHAETNPAPVELIVNSIPTVLFEQRDAQQLMLAQVPYLHPSVAGASLQEGRLHIRLRSDWAREEVEASAKRLCHNVARSFRHVRTEEWGRSSGPGPNVENPWPELAYWPGTHMLAGELTVLTDTKMTWLNQ